MRKPSKDFQTRYSAALRFRNDIRPYIEVILKFCCPGREFDFSSSTKNQHDVDTYISLPEEVATDLGGDLVTYFTPSEIRWASYEVIEDIPEDIAESVLELAQAREDTMFDKLISPSNYNDIAPQWGFEAATHGTPALWVEANHIAQPIHCEAVLPHELLVTPGHRGYLDRFREKTVAAETLKLLFPEGDLSDPKIKSKMDKPGATAKVCWGFWLDWSDPGNPMWMSEATVDGVLVTPEKQIIGPITGACPLLVGRFNPQPGKPWGRGSGRKALPDMQVLDKMDEIVMTGLDQSLLNTLIYPSDGALDLENGIVAGTAIPAGKNFDRNHIFELNRQTNVDQGWFAEERIEERIRRSFYQDGPRQRGDTPPTAAQWLDERRRVQQRLGKPSAPLWTEFVLPLIQRFEFLGVQLGILPDAITHNGMSVKVSPISPLQKAQNQDKVMVTRSNLDLGFSVFQDQLGQIVDPVATFKNIVKASGDELTVIAKEQNAPAAPPQ